MELLKLRQHPELAQAAAGWFHEKWGIPLEAYEESIRACLTQTQAVPQWYAAVEGGQILGGLGVIENDFHRRKDLTPNVCAVYVEQSHRCQGIAGKLLQFVCQDMKFLGVETLYLVTDHTQFYERYGWVFHCMVRSDDGSEHSRMYMKTLSF